MPERFKVYRGYNHGNRLGFSWTLSYHKARWFADRWKGMNGAGGEGTRHKPRVAVGMAYRTDVLACFLGRNEWEIVIEPASVDMMADREPIQLTPAELQWIEKMAKKFPLGKTSKYHGLEHWAEVARRGATLASDNGADPKIVRAFALCHDAARVDDGDDPEHGPRAASIVRHPVTRKMAMFRDFTDHDMKELLAAIEYHSHPGKPISTTVTIGTCWDADRMDLLRVNKIPQKKYLSTDIAKKLLWKI
jgi:uncharacterized protein